ncbi:MAG: BolA family transcriptional regulator [Omnitrophica WOR_2 bacterium RIFCSPHIGHO2_02_FULL_52_10]|nr:MAG: BolA family transcriptional regulator [Omnitrophica WOR_2 bacterium RIFCSPHIGHO2_02_FULL_52_10]
MITREIQKIIENSIENATVHVLDPMNDGHHLQAIVISPAFEGVPLIKQHKMVMTPLKEAFAQYVHALGLKTFTPEKWEQVKDQYNV